jgi:uncharacterized membrane-anchored protein
MNNFLSKIPWNLQLLASVVIQIAILLMFITSFGMTIATGTKVYLSIEPVDPRDPFRGDYVTFQYKSLSRMTVYTDNYNYLGNSYERAYLPTRITATSGTKFNVGDDVYVELTKGYSGLHEPSYSPVTKTKPKEGIFLKGKVESISPASYNSSINIKYGIEEYFIPENAGRNVSFFDKDVVAEVNIDKDGNSKLRRLFIDGKQWP